MVDIRQTAIEIDELIQRHLPILEAVVRPEIFQDLERISDLAQEIEHADGNQEEK